MSMTLSEIKDLKKQLGLTNARLADISGVPLSTIQKVLGNTTSAPRQKTLRKLEAALLSEYSHSYSHSGIPTSVSSAKEAKEQNLLKEAPAPYHTSTDPGRIHTIQDYYALPADRRAELIDGVFYAMAAPAELHQLVDLDIARQLSDCIERHELEESCFLFIAPCDVALGDESNTIVQPDLYVHCGPKKGSGKKNDDLHRGAPDFVVEVLSPSNPENDLWRKRELYRRHGVREYWIVDPREETLLVFLFDKMTEQPEEDLKETGRQTHSKTDKYGKEESTIDKVQEEKYTFEEEVPVHISGGLCKVDFRRVCRKIEHFFRMNQ